MKKSSAPFILFGLVIIAVSCKTAPEDKTPEPTPVETAKDSTSNTQESQTESKSETLQKPTTAATIPPNPEEAESKKAERKAAANEPAVSPVKTGTPKQSAKTTPQKEPTKAPAQKGTPQKTSAQSESAPKNKNISQTKNTQPKPAKQEPAQQKNAKAKTAAENTQKTASPETDKKEAAKAAAAKQGAAGKLSPATSVKQPGKKDTEQKPQEPAVHIAAAQITDILWMIEQADPSFVSKQHKGDGKMFVTMFAKYKGELTDRDFQEAFFASPADVWSLDEKNAKGLIEINKKDKLLTLKHLSAGEGIGAAALGKWFASITLAGQKPFEKELNVTGIGGQTVIETADTTAKGKSKKKLLPFIVPVAKAKNEQQALAMPVIQSVSRDADTIEIIFSINDSRVKNAYFYFDVPGEEYYRDSGSMIDATGKPVNGCRSFFTDGKKCQYVLRKDTSNKDWFGKAAQCFLVVSDVNRIASPWEEQHRSISAASRITK